MIGVEDRPLVLQIIKPKMGMTPQETAMVCADVTKALALGWKNPQMDMFSALVCK